MLRISQLVVPLLLSSAFVASVASLELVDTGVRLTANVQEPVAVYDGADSLYVLGGYDGANFQDTVVKFSLANGTVSVVGRLHEGLRSAAAFMDGQDIVYLGGTGADAYNFGVYRFSTVSGTSREVAGGWLSAQAAAFDPVSRVAHLFGGRDGYISSEVFYFDAGRNAYDVDEDAELPAAMFGSAAVWDAPRGVAYVIGGLQYSTVSKDILRYDAATGQVTPFPSKLPYALQSWCAAYAEERDEVYMLGGLELVRFSPGSGRVELVAVDRWPLRLQHAACVYVPALERLYVLGGYGSSAGEADTRRSSIAYVQL